MRIGTPGNRNVIWPTSFEMIVLYSLYKIITEEKSLQNVVQYTLTCTALYTNTMTVKIKLQKLRGHRHPARKEKNGIQFLVEFAASVHV